MKKLFLTAFFVTLLVFIYTAGAKAARPSELPATFRIPEHARRVAPGLYYLGKALDHGKVVEGYAFVDYKRAPGKPGTNCGNGICEPGEKKTCPEDCGGGGNGGGEDSSCYGFLAKGAKWKDIEPWIVNPANTRGLDSNFVFNDLSTDIDKWEAVADYDILGDGSKTTETLIADTITPDDQNEVYFAEIDDPGVIGVTIVWGYFTGPPKWRELVEWDQIYDDYDFDWSDSGEAGKMDFENIATHELGHSVGMDDLYTSECSEQTMYGYADYGETNKRSLEAGDIKGIQELYK